MRLSQEGLGLRGRRISEGLGLGGWEGGRNGGREEETEEEEGGRGCLRRNGMERGRDGGQSGRLGGRK